MININLSLTRPTDIAMPACGSGRVASARVLGDVTYAADRGKFPGFFAWSPPS